MKISYRISSMQSSPIRKLQPYADEAKLQGKKVYHLNIGQPDLPTPQVFYDAIRAYNAPTVSYAPSEGNHELRNAVARHYRRIGCNIAPDDIIITTGGSEAVEFALLVACDADDEALVFEPFYTNYVGLSSPYNINVRAITTSEQNNFAMPTMEEIEKYISPKTKAILITNPSNPTGRVYNYDEVRMICEIAKKYDLYIIADEVYREFVYDGAHLESFAAQTDVCDKVVIIDSISKRFSCCGGRVGFLITKNHEFIHGVMKLAMARLSSPTIAMEGARALYGLPNDFFDPIREEYQQRRNILCDCLNNIPGVHVKKPEGAFYVFPTLPIDDSEKFAKFLLQDFAYNNETVMVAPAGGFYKTFGLGKKEVRLAYVLKSEELQKAAMCLQRGLEAYNA